MDFSNEAVKSETRIKNDTTKIMNLRSQAEYMLQNVIAMTEMGMDMKERCASGEKYVCYLRSLSIKAGKTISLLQNTGKSFLVLAQKIVTSVMASLDNMPAPDQSCIAIKLEYENLLKVIERELALYDDVEPATLPNNIANMSEKIKYLETKQKLSDNHLLQHSGSVKSVKSDIDEKYPENWSRDSLIDLNNVVNLPPVPEDIFTSFPAKPTRTSSLSSLKSMRKVKLFLQRAANNSDDEDESSDLEEHDFSKIVFSFQIIFTYLLLILDFRETMKRNKPVPNLVHLKKVIWEI